MRTDIHSPTNFDPAAYTYVGSFDQYPMPGAFLNRAANPWSDYTTDFGVVSAMTWEHAEYLGGRNLLRDHGAHVHYDPDNGSCDCDHCGARIRYVCIYRHKDGQVIAVGNDCSQNRFGCSSRREYDVKTLKQRAADQRERQAAFGKAQAFCDANCPELSEWLLSPAAEQVHPIFADLARKLVKFGDMSEKQLAFARKLLQEHFERQHNGGKTDRQLAWEAEKAQAADCPRGRTTVTGVVVKLEERDTEWGVSLKLVIKDERGFAVWMTCPASLSCEKGDKVSVTVTLEPSDKDPKFGFGKRPTGGKVLEKVAEFV